ncbi:hypothetical protein ACFL6U_00495 [Planctomycetota bacterium]
MKKSLILFTLLLATTVQAQITESIGQADFSDWAGIATVKKEVATVKNGQTASFTYSNCDRVYFPGIKRDYYGDAANWVPYRGLAFEVYLNEDSTTEVTATLKVDPKDYDECNPVSTAKIRIVGKGWHSVYIPWEMFDIDAGQKLGTLFAIKHVELTFDSKDNSNVQLRDVHVTKGLAVALETAIRGKSSDAGTTVSYDIQVGNTTKANQGIQLRIETMGWESMKGSIEPSYVDLAPGESKTCTLTVSIPSKLPTGIREKQIVKAIANGKGAATNTLEFTTAVRVPSPNIMFTAEGWQGIRDKAKKYDWAQRGLEGYERSAQRWRTPKPREAKLGQSVFNTDGRDILSTAIAYQLTGKNEYAEKVLQLMRDLSDPKTGFPVTLVGGGNSFVAEGKFWQATGRAWDLVRDCERVTEEDRRLVDNTFRLFVTRTIQGNTRGAISNWNIAEITAALYCALNLQDWYLINQLLSSPTGVYAHLEQGIMNDGWWYECAVGYNTWVATEFSEIALALEPWGINFKDMTFPMGTTKHFSLLASRRVGGVMGMEFEKWGNIERNHVGIKDMWDSTINFLDYRGVILAVNDAIESKVSGKPYELAYYLYRDPEYAAIIKGGRGRDLLYGVPDLPDATSVKMTQSTYADNMGIVQLRSQTKEREQREQIQAAMHYGSHGGYHGHFDRTNLVHMSRYGRSFYGTLMYWYGYGSYLYKFLKQTSVNKNMVVVDEKQQEPVENFRTLYHSGEMMQATAVETNSRWSYPPYGGIVYELDSTFAEKMWDEGRSIPIPDNAPEYGTCTEYTEPVMQRRVMLVLDDYVVLADYLEGEKEHQFDWSFQAKGFKGITSDRTEYPRYTPQMNPDPLGSAQFVTSCQWYKTEGTSKTQFEMGFGRDYDNTGVRFFECEEGPLNIDVYNAWPKQTEIMIGTGAESHKVNKKLWYTVAADGETLLDDKTGAWILGSKDIELDITGKQQLVLTTRVDNTRNKTIFWGDARIVLADSKEVFISMLPVQYENIEMPPAQGVDYYNGPVKLNGEIMKQAIAGMPTEPNELATVTVDLSGLKATSFKAKIGGDFPMGDETERLKTMAVRTHGKLARYLAVVEPYESEAMVKSVIATSANDLVVELADGRVQEITIRGLDREDSQIMVSVKELKDGQVVRAEQTE